MVYWPITYVIYLFIYIQVLSLNRVISARHLLHALVGCAGWGAGARGSGWTNLV
jgi:uncharacterized MnhB-related membrane protein